MSSDGAGRTSTRAARARREGFTLIEVLMGVLVLGLGLLGLAAIFPAVVVQQRQAADAVEGEVTATVAEAALRGNDVFAGRVLGDPAATGTPTNQQSIVRFMGLFETLVLDENFSAQGAWTTQSDSYGLSDRGVLTVALREVLRSDRGEANDSTPRILAYELPVTSRLVPAAKIAENVGSDAAWREIGSRGDEPRFVWDFAVRRSAAVDLLGIGRDRTLAERAADAVQVAVFVRRIDTGIRSAGDAQPLSRRLRDPGSALVPVAENNDRLPTSNGTGSYSVIRELVADRTAQAREMDVSNINPVGLRNQIAQVGQKFVVGGRDSEATILEVRSVRTAGGRTVLEMDRPLPVSRVGDVDVSFLYTPQAPVAVRLLTIDPKRTPGDAEDERLPYE
jgi:prepilin-type N-terminal cleavage/methylation domain-containing protein